MSGLVCDFLCVKDRDDLDSSQLIWLGWTWLERIFRFMVCYQNFAASGKCRQLATAAAVFVQRR